VAKAPHKGAFYTLSYGRFVQQWALWNRNLPNVKPYYAVKCNPDPTLLRWLTRRGASFDCASAREMFLVKEQFGKEPLGNQVLFANPCKTPHDIQVAKDLKIPWVTADSTEELVKMDQAGYRPDTLLRISVDDSDSSSPFSAKFGLQPDKVAEVALAAASFRIPIVGISFHVGSGSKSPSAYGSAVHLAHDVWNMLYGRKLVKYQMACLDIGGGWSPEPKLFQNQATAARLALQRSPIPRQLIAEPGRFFAAPTHNLYVRIVGKKPSLDGKGYRYTLDESVYGQFSCIPFDHAEPRLARLRKPGELERKHSSATLFGRTCDSLDWIANVGSMEELDVGDWLYVPNMGAYTTATSTEFNGFPKPDVIETDDQPEDFEVSWIEKVVYPLAKMLQLPS
jgi:ornithine decarboxylase